MKDEATPEQLAMARRIAASELRNHNDWADLYRDAVLRGDYDGSDGVRCALAAIIETTENIAEWLVSKDEGALVGYTPKLLAKHLRAGKHYGKDEGKC